MARSFIEKIRSENTLENEYSRDLNLAFTVSLVLFIAAFLFVRGCTFQGYNPKKPSEIQGEEINIQAEIEEPPPPPPKPKISLPEEIVETTEEEADTVEIQETVDFDESEIPPPPAPTETVFELYQVDEPPEVVVQVQPEYPEVARKAGLEGKVIVAAVVDENGNVIKAEIHRSDNPIFNEAALAAARKMKFKPAKQKDIPVKVKVFIPFTFKLRR